MRSKFKLGDLIVVREPIDVSSRNITIDTGERGKVIDVDPDTKDLTIRLSGYHPELNCRNGLICLSARDANNKIKRTKSASTFKRTASLLIGTALVCTTLMIGADWLNDNMVIAALRGTDFPSAAAAATTTGCTSHDLRLHERNSIYSTKFNPAATVNDLITAITDRHG